MDAPDLSTSELIERYYLQFKNANKPTAFSNGKFIKHYDEAAAICDSLKANPHDFVSSVFASADPERILPSFLHNKNVAKNYERYMSTKKQVDYDALYDYNKKVLNQQLALGFSEEEILLTSFICFEPWFRICYPKKDYQSIRNKWLVHTKPYNTEKMRTFLHNKNHNFVRLFQ